uniref:FBD domain-containing protein n=1 Tax=Brassica campestris TaxID=3711 RepID=M4CT93_BRACM
MSKSLVRLRVSGTDEFTIIDVGEVSLSLPKLNTLHMNDVGFADESGAAFAKLVSSCHALEELVMDKIMWDFRGSCSVSNSSLKRVTIYSENIDDEDPKNQSADAGSSEEDEYLFESDDDEEKEMVGNATNFFKGICNVQILYLSAKTLEKLQSVSTIASPKCNLQVISQNLSLSSTLPCSLTKKWSAPPNEEYTWFLKAVT